MQHSAKRTSGHTRPDRFSSIVMKRPLLVVTLCFVGAMALVTLVGLRQLYTIARSDLQNRQRDLEVRAVGVDALIDAERRHLVALRNYAEHVLAAGEQQRIGLESPAVRPALAHTSQPVWQVPGLLGGPAVFGTNAAGLADLDGFHRDDAALPGDIALARALSPLVEISHQADAMRGAVAFVSPNGMFVSAPEHHGMSTPELLRHFSTMYYYRGQLPEHNPRRDVLWTPVYTGLQDGEAVSTLSAPVYLGNQFRGVVVMDITQSRLLSLRLSTGNIEDNEDPLDFGLLNTNGSVVYFRNGAVIAQRPARFSPRLLQTAANSVDTWMRQGSGYIERNGQYLLYRRIGQSHWILLAATDNAELTIATARRVLGSPLIAAWIVLGLLLIGTLRIVTNIFGHYMEASERLETLARSDPLTGLANRRRFQEVFAEAHERANRAPQQPASLAVLMLDIDFFKRVNDRFGHAAGDRVLTILADILRATLRGVDLPARMGGEEFAALLPDTDLAAVTAVAERVRHAIESHARDATVPASTEHPEAIAFTVSIGVAASPVDGPIDYEALMHVADARLYLAKQGGRNRVVHASAPMPDVKA